MFDETPNDGDMCSTPQWMSRFGWLIIAIVAIVVGLTIIGRGQPPNSATMSVPAPTTSVAATTSTASPTTIAVIELPAVATEVAVRVNPPSTAPIDPCEAAKATVNALPYEVLNPEPVRTAYRAVASACRGWDQATIARWEQFAVDDVPMGESVGCPLVRGGAYGVNGMCEIDVQGRREDVGIGQLIALWYSYPSGVLCPSEGYCSAASILASPFDSFNAYLAAIEHNGSASWCYDARARRLHWSCDETPRHWPA